ncbi:smoothelin isoform X2 [Narcine bancroftii]|uniref:smoothelin isoform X2 n=1 Tax=Narcine bancroftii TaxID=1343680 RepID=UPI0038322354
MSADRYSSLDEPALRKLLEVTDDFDERKLIRSTIYELRRKELKRTEDALSSKRFRSERTNKCLENKENHLRSHRQEEDQKGSLDKLSGKLETINDIDELTTLLRNAGEYEERKLIRAAMRKLREQEIEAASTGDRPIGRTVHNGAQDIEKTSTTYRLDITPQTVRSSNDLLPKCEENVLQTLVAETEDQELRTKIRSQIQDHRNQKKRGQKMASSMVVDFDPLKQIEDRSLKSLQTSRQKAESSGLDPCTSSIDSDWDSKSGKDSNGGLAGENPRTASETQCTIKIQHNKILQKGSSSVAEEDDDAKNKNANLNTNGCSLVNDNKSIFAQNMETTGLQAETSSQNGMLTSVQKRLHSDVDDNIPSQITRRASDKEQGGTCFIEHDKMMTYKDQMARNLATQSKQKELTEMPIDTNLNSSPLRRTNSVQDRVKKFTVDLPKQSTELGTNFSTQKRNQLNENRSSRILQQQLSGSPTLKLNESASSGPKSSLKGNSVDLMNLQKVDKSTEKTDKQNEYLLSSRSKKLIGSNKRNGIERDRKTSLRESLLSSEQMDGKFLPKSANRLTYRTAKSNFTIPEVPSQGSSRATFSSVSSSESLLSHPVGTGVPVDGSSKSTLPLFSCEKDCSKKSLMQKTATDKSYIRTSGRSNISKSYQLASEKDSSKSDTECSGHLKQPRSAEHSEPSDTPNRHFHQSLPRHIEKEKQLNNSKINMKTLMTIEIKDGRNPDLVTTRITGTPSSQRGELTFGLRAAPFRMMGPGGIMTETKPAMTEAAQSLQFEGTVPNGVEEKEKENAKEKKSKAIQEDLSAIEDEEVLDKMLDVTMDFEKRKMIRTAMRELRKKKRDEREREREMRLQELKQKTEEAKKAKSSNTAEMTISKTEKSADGKTVTSMSKTERITHSDGGNRTLQTATVESSVVKKVDGGTSVIQTKTSFSSSSTSAKKVGSVFDREDSTRSSSVLALERKQAEKRKEVLRSQTLPKTSGSQARKALIEKLEKESGSPGNPAIAKVKVQRSSSCGVPNANSIKQMLLDWCRAKTRGYEHVTIQNFSSSWSDGMAFCALVHNFFPEAFDYSELKPNNPRHNFEVAFTMAEKHADCPQLLDVEDMVRMKEPDWKCVYTYIQEYYRCLVQKGLVKTKTSS